MIGKTKHLIMEWWVKLAACLIVLSSLNIRIGAVGKGATKQQSGVVVLVGAAAARAAPLPRSHAPSHLLVLQTRVELH